MDLEEPTNIVAEEDLDQIVNCSWKYVSDLHLYPKVS